MIRLPYVVEVQERVETIGADGGVMETWRTTEKRRVQIETMRSGEGVQAGAVQEVATHRVTMRNGGGTVVEGHHRLRFGARIFNVLGVTRDLRRPGATVATVAEVVNLG